MSGLKQYALTTGEASFLKTMSTDFDKTQVLTAHQEGRVETLYREKSELTPNKNRFALKESSSQKAKSRRPTGKYY